MDSERHVTRIVRAWLRTDEHESADRILDDVLVMVDTKAQRPAAWSMRRVRTMNAPRRRLSEAAVAAAVVAVVGIGLLTSFGGFGGPGTPTSPSPAASTPAPANQVIPPGSYQVPWPDGQLLLTMPAGWSSAAGTPEWPAQAGTTITRYPMDAPGHTLTLNLVHDVTRVVTDVCVEGRQEAFVEVGPTVEDLTTALSNQVGVQKASPMDVTIGGYPATKFILTMSSTEFPCPGPEAKRVWANATTNGLVLLKDGTTTIYVVNVNGDRLVITSLDRGSPGEDVAQLNAIVASIEIQHEGVTPACVTNPSSSCVLLGGDRHEQTVEGVPLSFRAPGWTPFGRISLNYSMVGPQGAEGIVYWTTFPDGTLGHPCANLSGLGVGARAADLAAAVATAPGTQLVSGPSDGTVGGRAAKYVVVTVREPLGCDPGYFFRWHDYQGGPFWRSTDSGVTIRVWIVDVGGKILFIAGETNVSIPSLDQQIQKIIDSIQFK